MTKVCSVPVTRAMLQLIPGRWYESELGAWCGALPRGEGFTPTRFEGWGFKIRELGWLKQRLVVQVQEGELDRSSRHPRAR